MPKQNPENARIQKKKNPDMDLEVVDFSDLEQLEESIAPIFLIPAAGGKCGSGGQGPHGCSCQ